MGYRRLSCTVVETQLRDIHGESRHPSHAYFCREGLTADTYSTHSSLRTSPNRRSAKSCSWYICLNEVRPYSPLCAIASCVHVTSLLFRGPRRSQKHETARYTAL
ncbi:hypothetical protein M404DRAFT_995626 [Pisolithus tinctorius Marx 270]|uniref:Uncharacterized protein n=1 Tax=Pisolithus tinctorius Marx 270 TaxID=870435 RepID=A0A0C3JMN0_PISTI|nr:hypothetical protein M404DRAFT_995626 [Pisolithus tinctorius Marx 270]